MIADAGRLGGPPDFVSPFPPHRLASPQRIREECNIGPHPPAGPGLSKKRVSTHLVRHRLPHAPPEPPAGHACPARLSRSGKARPVSLSVKTRGISGSNPARSSGESHKLRGAPNPSRIGCDQIASWLAGQGRDGFVDRRVVMDGSKRHGGTIRPLGLI